MSRSTSMQVHILFAHGYGIISTVAIAIGGVSAALLCFIIAGAMTLQSPPRRRGARYLTIAGVIALVIAFLSPLVGQTLKLP